MLKLLMIGGAGLGLIFVARKVAVDVDPNSKTGKAVKATEVAWDAWAEVFKD